MSSRGYSQKVKQSQGEEENGTGSMSEDFRKGKSRLGDSPTYPVPFESKDRINAGPQNRTFAPIDFVLTTATYF